MTRKAADKIRAGLEDALAYAEGDKKRGAAHRIKLHDVDAAIVRRKTKLSQSQFAARIGVSVATLKNWEQGHRKPSGPARVLLNMLERNPRLVEETLR
jgi:putative transcriptional regulator